MRTWVLGICLAALVWGAAETPDFRSARWGMNQDQVMAKEAGRPERRMSSGELVLTYRTSLPFVGFSGRVAYFFAAGKLVRAKYLLDGNVGDPDSFVADFRKLDAPLRELYGRPGSDRAFWQDDESQTERKSYLEQDRGTPGDLLPSDAFLGQTLAEGHLKLYTQWTTARTEVLHGLTGDAGKITHQIEYRSTEFEKLENEVRARAASAGTAR